jgi:uncharacterized repeat protein (TIGR01451 family)
MKKISTLIHSLILSIVFTGVFCEAEAQMVYLPDTNFRNKLINLGYGSCITGDSIDSGCALVTNATNLNVGNSNISDLQGIQSFINLDTLYCKNNILTSLPSLPDSLQILDCNNNFIISLPALPANLKRLWCGYNPLDSLPSTLPGLLELLSCDSNLLDNLPSLPNSLTILYCSYNNFTSLPPLPPSLKLLVCYDDNLTSLPSLPASLTKLKCWNNQLTTLPSMPPMLTWLECGDNLLTSLPPLPSSLLLLECRQNMLTALPELPPNLEELYCSNNYSLSCLPFLPQSIFTFYFTNTAVSCMPNYLTTPDCWPALTTSYPLCNLFNSNGCYTFSNINGKSYFDSNLNCVFDSADALQSSVHMMLYKNGSLQQQTYSNVGQFSFTVIDTGNYNLKIDTNDLAFDVLCPLSLEYNDSFYGPDTIFGRDFSLKCKPGFDLGALSISSIPFVPDLNRTINIFAGDITNFYGAHCANGIGGNVTLTFTGPISYIGPAAGAVAPTNVSGNTLTYDIADFGTVDLFTAFNIIVHTDTLAVLGSQVCFTVNVSLLAGDNNPLNNTLSHCFTVVGSYDPNNKEVYPTNDVDVNGDRWLIYTINFQNTGTASAEHIYVTDTLSSNFDLSTFQLLAYSHQPLVQILEGGIARFNFPNINLPDSNANEPLSHGHVQYKIKLKDGLSVGTQTTNTAYIYFDFSTPVVTNTTSNTLVVTDISSIANSNVQLKVYPNPSTNIFNFQFNDSWEQIKKIAITDITGREVYSVGKNVNELNATDLTSGIYFYSVFTKSERLFVGKLIKN